MALAGAHSGESFRRCGAGRGGSFVRHFRSLPLERLIPNVPILIHRCLEVINLLFQVLNVGVDLGGWRHVRR